MTDLPTGTRLGPYEILSRIGAGGMGEVFRARDTRLERTVAIKVLPREFAGNAQLRLRFEREAKAISQLTHPHICTLHDVGQTDGIDYLVLEYIEGTTLADRISRGPLPLADVLRFGGQIAAALDRAHREGIVHRDLKPSNVMITKSGVKLLDFGLARSIVTTISPTDATLQKSITHEGTVVGTYQYMAPEQLAGEECDARADIFALGAVLYEMLTGTRAFTGKTKTSLVASILSGEPRPVSELQPMTPPALQHVIEKCLAKDRDDRWQSAADIASELEWIGRMISDPAAAPQRRSRGPRAGIAAVAVAAIVVSAAIAGAIWASRRLALAERPVRSELVSNEPLVSGLFGAVVLSPDETRLAMLVGPPGKPVLAVRDLASGETKKLAATEGASFPFWSPDSRRIGFFADGKLKTIAVEGGSTQVVCDAKQGRGGAWSRRGVIVFAPDIRVGLHKVGEDGGTPVAITRTPEGAQHRTPHFLPDGKTFLFTEGRATDQQASIHVASIDGMAPRPIALNGFSPTFSRGWLFVVRDLNLIAQRFDPKALVTSGSPVTIAGDVEYFMQRHIGHFSVTPNRIVHVSPAWPHHEIVISERNGRSVALDVPRAIYRILGLSPDERTLAVSTDDRFGKGDIWLIHMARGGMSRLTFDNRGFLSAAFSPDGKRIATSSGPPGAQARLITLRSLDGSGAQPVIARQPIGSSLTGWLRTGHLVTVVQHPESGFDVELFSIDGQTRTPVLRGPADELAPSVSPDGKWLAYVSTESGAPQVYVTTFPAGEGKWQVTREGGSTPQWSHDGTELFYANDDYLHAVAFRTGPIPEFGTPVRLPVQRANDAIGIRSVPALAVLRDGRFVTVRDTGAGPKATIHLITNWEKLVR